MFVLLLENIFGTSNWREQNPDKLMIQQYVISAEYMMQCIFDKGSRKCF